jgi:hypothetical protein
MNLYNLVIFVHVAAAVALLSGSVIGSPGVRAAVRRARTTQELRAYVSLGRRLQVLEPVCAVVLLISGAYLASVANFWSLGWVQAAVAFWVVNSAFAGTMVKPALARLSADVATSADGPVGEHLERLRWSARWSFAGDLLMANDAAVLYLMVMQPGLASSLLIVAGANLGVAAVRALTVGYGFRGATAAEAASTAPTEARGGSRLLKEAHHG